MAAALSLPALAGAAGRAEAATLSPAFSMLGWSLAGALAVACAVLVFLWLHARRSTHAPGVEPLHLQALNALPTGALVADGAGKPIWCNAAWRHMAGNIHGDVAAAIEAALDDAARGEAAPLRDAVAHHAAASAELRFRGRGAAGPASYRVEVRPLSGASRMTLWTLDAAAQATVPERIGEHHVAEFLGDAPLGFYAVDGEGRFVAVNDTMARWTGRDRAALIDGGARLADIIAEGVRPGAPAHAPFAADGDESRGEVILLGADGRRFQASVIQNVFREPGGGVRYARALVRDLTAEQDRAEALRRSDERFHRFFDEAPVGIVLVDARGTITEFSTAFGEMIGCPGDDIVGRGLAACAIQEDRDRIAQWVAGAVAGKDTQPLQATLAGEKKVNASLFARRIESRDGACEGLVVHTLDQTEQRNLETQFFQSQKMDLVGKLAGGIAHDFNNLLTAMIGFCDLLLQRYSAKDQSFGDIMQIKQNANRAANLVRQLLAFSRQQTLQPRVLGLTDILAELSHLLRRLIGANITLDLVHGRDLGLIKADQSQLEQVIINLAVNARDAMDGGGTLTIRTRAVLAGELASLPHGPLPPGEYVMLAVTDTGCGISKEHLGQIFEPFFTTKAVGSGTGLGLSTVYGIVKQTGGHIFVDSAPGEGATFTVYLPRVAAGEAAVDADQAEEARVAARRDLTGAGTVMLVEDEDAVRMFGARALRNKGYTVVEAPSGEEALAMLREGDRASTIDVLITDVVMPGMDGPSMIRQVRETHPDMKVIFISGYTEDSFRQRLDDSEDIHFLPKPFTLQQLAGKVKEIMNGETGAGAAA
jgi:two-component system cell cycle sensor histidine kinase/response regulator CckA